jgi:hypothetical protein
VECREVHATFFIAQNPNEIEVFAEQEMNFGRRFGHLWAILGGLNFGHFRPCSARKSHRRSEVPNFVEDFPQPWGRLSRTPVVLDSNQTHG